MCPSMNLMGGSRSSRLIVRPVDGDEALLNGFLSHSGTCCRCERVLRRRSFSSWWHSGSKTWDGAEQDNCLILSGENYKQMSEAGQ